MYVDLVKETLENTCTHQHLLHPTIWNTHPMMPTYYSPGQIPAMYTPMQMAEPTPSQSQM